MFNWFRREQEPPIDRQLVGDLDALRRKVYEIKFKGKFWRSPDLTIKQYAQFCACLQEIEDLNKAPQSDSSFLKTEKAYDDVFRIAIPSLPWKLRRELTMEDATLLFLLILKRYGITGEKKKTDQLSPDLGLQKPNS